MSPTASPAGQLGVRAPVACVNPPSPIEVGGVDTMSVGPLSAKNTAAHALAVPSVAVKWPRLPAAARVPLRRAKPPPLPCWVKESVYAPGLASDVLAMTLNWSVAVSVGAAIAQSTSRLVPTVDTPVALTSTEVETAAELALPSASYGLPVVIHPRKVIMRLTW